MRKLLQVSMLATAITLAASGLASAQVKDAWVTAKTKVVLMTTDDLKTSDLNVDTVEGVVTLHGKVPTADQRDRAEKVAMGVDGVKAVKNLLQVVPAKNDAAVTISDSEVRGDIEQAFKANAAIAKSGIKVTSVNNGVVLIGGGTDSIVTHLQAIETAYNVKGVRRVSSEVKVDERLQQ